MRFFYAIALTFLFCAVKAPAQIVLKDIFKRNLANQTIILTDWEGYMANPATRLTVSAPANATFPLTVNLTANGALLYFDMPSTAAASGPSKTITLNDNKFVSFYLSDFPDRDSISEKYTLTISTSQYGNQNFAVKVIDQDLPSYESKFKITVDFSQDTSYHFFNSAARRNILQTVCDDWAYFINDHNFDAVDAGAQSVYIWGDNYHSTGHFAYNSKKYKGYYLFAYGLMVDPNIAGGSPSTDNFQTIKGNATGLRRAGGFNVDPRGNYNSLGWSITYTDNTWFLATNLGEDTNDLYSIAHHEIGHALCFNPGYTVFNTYKQQGYINDSAFLSYTKTPVYINQYDHLVDSSGNLLADRISKKGVFGSEYANDVPFGRWLITKTDLLVLKLIGYDIKNTSAFSVPAITTKNLPDGAKGSAYTASVIATGGIPFYNYSISSGTLPQGLNINAFSGVISGTPTQSGNYTFKVQVMDYDSVNDVKKLTINVGASLNFIAAAPSLRSDEINLLQKDDGDIKKY